MDFLSEYTTNVYTIPIENIGDSNAIERANQAKPVREEASEKSLQALARRQRRLEGLQLFEKTKLNRYTAMNSMIESIVFFISV